MEKTLVDIVVGIPAEQEVDYSPHQLSVFNVLYRQRIFSIAN